LAESLNFLDSYPCLWVDLNAIKTSKLGRIRNMVFDVCWSEVAAHCFDIVRGNLLVVDGVFVYEVHQLHSTDTINNIFNPPNSLLYNTYGLINHSQVESSFSEVYIRP
jgi:hypothetical protein